MFSINHYDHAPMYAPRVGLTEDQKTEIGAAMVFGIVGAVIAIAYWTFAHESTTIPESIQR